MFQKMTDDSRRVCNLAGAEAIAAQADEITTVHLLIALLDSESLRDLCVSADALRSFASSSVTPATAGHPGLGFSENALTVLRHASQAAVDVITPADLLRAIAEVPCSAHSALAAQGLSIDWLLDHAPTSAADEPSEPEQTQPRRRNRQRHDSLDPRQWMTDLTQLAGDGTLSPVAGRDRETNQVMLTLCRATKNVPVLVGPAGVGKTAIVEGLAQRITAGQVPGRLADMKIMSLSLAALVGGTRFRGDFEDRMQRLMTYCEEHRNVVLFIDEIHSVLGAGASEGSLDAATILKPAMARGAIRVIGATTDDEYQRHLTRDPAFERRLNPIPVGEPDDDLAEVMVRAAVVGLAAHHHVTFAEDTPQLAVDLCRRYLQDRVLPDGAIDLLDQAAAVVVLDHDAHVTGVHLEARASEMSGRDVSRDATAQLLGLEDRLHRRVIAQPDALRRIAAALLRSQVGLADERRPIGSFLLCGPSGIGKTETARALAAELYGSQDALIRIDMSDCMDAGSVSKLIGAAPGYVGHDRGGQLSDSIRKHPHSVVVFDEIDKAHPDVLNVLLAILEEGEITDSRGRRCSFRSAVVLLTSNDGAQWAAGKRKPAGFASVDQIATARDAVTSRYRPELLNRLDAVVMFEPLDAAALRQIAELHIDQLASRCRRRGVDLRITGRALEHLACQAAACNDGARPLRHLIDDLIVAPAAQLMAAGQHDRITVRVENNSITVR